MFPKEQSLLSEVQFIAVRSRGPGGQNVNKVSSAAILYWDYSHSQLLTLDQKYLVTRKLQAVINKENLIFMRSDEFRDLERNKARCLEKLSHLLTQALHKAKPRKPTKPTAASKKKKREHKSRRSETKRSRQKIW